MDLHPIVCDPYQCTQTGTRTFPVATSILDEDWGRDEIRLTLWAGDGTNLSSSGSITGTGNF